MSETKPNDMATESRLPHNSGIPQRNLVNCLVHAKIFISTQETFLYYDIVYVRSVTGFMLIKEVLKTSFDHAILCDKRRKKHAINTTI